MIRILIVDDSETEIIILKHIFEKDKDLQVIGYAKNGAQAVKLVPILKPDLITMDVQMPIMDGVEATRIIMSTHPTPIVIISSKLNAGGVNHTFRALEAGALTVMEKPVSIISSQFAQSSKRIIDIIHSMAEIKPITRRFHFNPQRQKPSIEPVLLSSDEKYALIAIGASVGGPQALKYIFSQLPANFPVPILVVQHITPGFINDLANWLNENIKLTVKVAENFELLSAGTIYFAPDNCHLTIQRSKKNLFSALIKKDPVSGFCPSISVLLDSVTFVCGSQAIGILLTGMGNDGAQGLLALKKAGGHTLIQDQASCIVFGMAGVAQSLNAVDSVIELDNMADYLIKITKDDHR